MFYYENQEERRWAPSAAEYGGHSSIGVTAKHYAFLSVDDLEKAINA